MLPEKVYIEGFHEDFCIKERMREISKENNATIGGEEISEGGEWPRKNFCGQLKGLQEGLIPVLSYSS